VENDLEISQSGSVPIFDWRDEVNDRILHLLINNVVKEEKFSIGNLFQDQTLIYKISFGSGIQGCGDYF